jgi:multidrug efflux pump subunit AcrA (membrane-fusion protein)
MVTLFTRAGVEQKPNGANEKGAPVYRYERSCNRCGGLGGSDAWAHTGWKCYDCGGSGKAATLGVEKLYDAEKLAKLNTTKAKADEKKAKVRAEKAAAEKARADRERDQVRADHKDLIDRLVRIAGDKITEEGFFQSIHDQVMVQSRNLSERQIEAVTNSLDKMEAEIARRAAATHVGTVGESREFTLTLVKVASYGSQYDLGGVKYYCTFKDENGCKVLYKGTSPHSLGLVRKWDDGYFYPTGQVVRVKAKIADHTHNKYTNEPETVIQRPKALANVA